MRLPIVFAALLISGAALAMPNEAFQGKPDFSAGAALGAYAWHDSDGHHVRFTTVDNKTARQFSGKVCGANITDLRPVRTDVADGIRVGPDGKCVGFDFRTNAGVDGFDFRMPDGDIVYEINIDGAPMATRQIHVGKTGISPKNNPFSLNRNEK
jgi:hypothetical protein